MIACADSGVGFSGEPSAWQGTGGGAGFSFAASRASAATDLGHCVICLDGFGDDIEALGCGHIFHQRCAAILRERGRGVCPTCRVPLQQDYGTEFANACALSIATGHAPTLPRRDPHPTFQDPVTREQRAVSGMVLGALNVLPVEDRESAMINDTLLDELGQLSSRELVMFALVKLTLRDLDVLFYKGVQLHWFNSDSRSLRELAWMLQGTSSAPLAEPRTARNASAGARLHAA
jgi:hypothetical protein